VRHARGKFAQAHQREQTLDLPVLLLAPPAQAKGDVARDIDMGE